MTIRPKDTRYGSRFQQTSKDNCSPDQLAHLKLRYYDSYPEEIDARWRNEGRSHAGIVWCSERTVLRRAIGQPARLLAEMSRRHESLTALCLPMSR